MLTIMSAANKPIIDAATFLDETGNCQEQLKYRGPYLRKQEESDLFNKQRKYLLST